MKSTLVKNHLLLENKPTALDFKKIILLKHLFGSIFVIYSDSKLCFT